MGAITTKYFSFGTQSQQRTSLLERNHNNVLLFWMGGAAIGVRVTVINRPLEL